VRWAWCTMRSRRAAASRSRTDAVPRPRALSPPSGRGAGPFFSRLRPGSWGPLFRLDPTSLSTSVGAGCRRTSNSEPHDNAHAKCGARECPQDQHHDLLPDREHTTALNASRSTGRHEIGARIVKLTGTKFWPPKLTRFFRQGPCSAPTDQSAATGLEGGARPPSVFPVGGAMRRRP
jgi:hypothetical protein